MKLSVIVVNYNTKKLTLECLVSLEKHPLSEKFEVTLVDNGSSDDSITAFKKFKPKKYDLKIIENKENLGFSKANNIGIKKSKGKYKLLLNSDTGVTKHALDDLVNFAEGKENLGAVVPRLLNADGSVQASVFSFPTVTKTFKQWWLEKKGLLDPYYPKSKNPVQVEAAVMAAFLITPIALKKVGLLNEKYFMFYEDFDYCREISKADLKIYYLPDVAVYHHHGSSGKNVAKSNKQWYRLLRGSRIYHGFLKHYLILFIQRSADVFQRRILGK